ncbi:MAG: site-specific integrase [Chloroflexi bacterium]|nr:site-specific integrase [Chloroflexota bacterium]
MLLIACSLSDREFAQWLASQLAEHQYQTKIIHRVGQSAPDVSAALMVISPDGIAPDFSAHVIDQAKASQYPVWGLVARSVNPLPDFVAGVQLEDFTTKRDAALKRLLDGKLPSPQLQASPGSKTAQSIRTFNAARDSYLARAALKSQHTMNAYERSINLFFDFLGDRSIPQVLPIQRLRALTTGDIPLHTLSHDDEPMLAHFVRWLALPSSGKRGDKRPYRLSTIELRLAGVQHWLHFLQQDGWLPDGFSLEQAKSMARQELTKQEQPESKPPDIPDTIEEVIHYYDTQQRPKYLNKPEADPDRARRWELTRLRNRALLHSLSDTGGRISEILSLNLSNFTETTKRDVLLVEVTGKGGHTYHLHFAKSLAAIRSYIHTRGTTIGDSPLFVSHDPRYDGNRMSRVVAWRVVQRAAKALGLPNITPHDFRHWRASQLVTQGLSPDDVQDYLGHRSVETTRVYFAEAKDT